MLLDLGLCGAKVQDEKGKQGYEPADHDREEDEPHKNNDNCSSPAARSRHEPARGLLAQLRQDFGRYELDDRQNAERNDHQIVEIPHDRDEIGDQIDGA
jgi:hypothetical protein